MGYGAQSIDHIIGSAPPSQDAQLANQANSEYLMQPHQPVGQVDPKDAEYLPIEPIYLNQQEEHALMNDVSRELGSYRTDELKRFYTELTSYDPNLTGFTHHAYISLVAMRNNVCYLFLFLCVFPASSLIIFRLAAFGLIRIVSL